MSAYELAALRDEAARPRAQVRRWEAWSARVEQMQASADGAFGEHRIRLQTITNAIIELKMTVKARGTVDVDGYPVSGPTGEERLKYELLEAERAGEEQRWQRWVADARIAESDAGGCDRSWSPRHPSDAARQHKEAVLVLAHLGQALAAVERQLAELEEASAAPVPAPAEPQRSGFARIFGG